MTKCTCRQTAFHLFLFFPDCPAYNLRRGSCMSGWKSIGSSEAPRFVWSARLRRHLRHYPSRRTGLDAPAIIPGSPGVQETSSILACRSTGPSFRPDARWLRRSRAL